MIGFEQWLESEIEKCAKNLETEQGDKRRWWLEKIHTLRTVAVHYGIEKRREVK